MRLLYALVAIVSVVSGLGSSVASEGARPFSAGEPIDRLLRFDLGPGDARAPGAWNHITRAETGGVVVKEAIDATGARTAVRVRQLDAWSGVNREGARKGAPWVAEATGDSLYLGDHGDRRAAVRFENLVPGEKYELVMFGSRMGEPRPRATRYSAGGKSVSLESQDNVIGVATLADVVADAAGRILLETALEKGQDFGYLGVIEVRGRVGAAGTAIERPLPEGAPPSTTARGWAVADGRTGKILHGRFERTPFEMASTTKVMSALIVLALADKDAELMDTMVTVSAQADATRGSSAHVRVGDRLTVRDLLHGLLLPSGNDAALALSEHLGSRLPVGPSGKQPTARFVDEMNRRARNLGLTQTRYRDPHGNSANRSSPADLLRVAWAAMQDATFRGIVSKRSHVASVTSKEGRRRALRWRNTNRLLALAGCDGIKTGTTRSAGSCLVASFNDVDDHLLIVVLGAASDAARYVDTKNLLRWAREARAGGK